jgi:anthranilate phosphoribosyltransferase
LRSLPELIKHVGRGARLAKELPEDEAEAAMRALVSGAADPVQIGAFLLAMRMKGETAGELAGFVRALRAETRLELGGFDLDVDLHGDGRAARPSIALAAACVVASFGARVLVRGWFGSKHARNDIGDAFARMGLVTGGGKSAPVVIVDLETYAPRVAALLALRERIGVRTCVQSAVKLLDPAGARRVVCGIFHTPYHEPMAGALLRLGVVRAAVVQAPGGVPELAPDRPTRTSRVDGGRVVGPEPFAPTAEAAPEDAPDAASLAELLGAVLAGRGPAGVLAMTVATASLWRWVAGQIDDPLAPDSLDACRSALAGGRAQELMRAARLC